MRTEREMRRKKKEKQAYLEKEQFNKKRIKLRQKE
jgi:hypothetical protein